MSAAQVGEWRAFEAHYGPLLLHERLDWVIALLTIIASPYVKEPLELPPWLNDQESGGADLDPGPGPLLALAQRSKHLKED